MGHLLDVVLVEGRSHAVHLIINIENQEDRAFAPSNGIVFVGFLVWFLPDFSGNFIVPPAQFRILHKMR